MSEFNLSAVFAFESLVHIIASLRWLVLAAATAATPAKLQIIWPPDDNLNGFLILLLNYVRQSDGLT